MDLLYFVILVSSLIFVHELGHFAFAKIFGVKVLTFSLGFGPKILRLRGRETEYCISLLPLGGYVKMLEASKTDIVLPEDKNRTFESLPIYKRIIVVLAGPMMNLVFPVLLYFCVFVTDGPFLPPTVGVVLPGHPAAGKLFPGDRIMAVNGQDVGTFDELKRIVSKNPSKPVRFTVFRDNKQVEVEVTGPRTAEPLPITRSNFRESCAAWLADEGVRPRPPGEYVTVLNLRDGEPVPSPFNLRFGVDGFGVCAAGQTAERTGHFVLELRQEGRATRRHVLDNGATQLNLDLPDGRYGMTLRFVSATGTELLPAYEATLVVAGQNVL